MLLALVLLCGVVLPHPAQATFSIVAVDPETGQVGSAGASCIAGSIIISDVHPAVGVVHTQSYWNSQNQQYAHFLMDQGYSPEAIIDSLVANDAGNNPTIRQYGIVDLVDGGRSAAFTGVNCFDYKGHILGPNYAIQGNILLGPQILEAMEEGFLNTSGTLADKLMAALQGANVPGADTRCLDDGKSSISAFIRVAQPHDEENDLYLHLNVNNTGPGQEPIDLLQELYDEWKASTSAPQGGLVVKRPILFQNEPNPFHSTTEIRFGLPVEEYVSLRIFDVMGRQVATLADGMFPAGLHSVRWRDPSEATGVYLYRLKVGSTILTRKLMRLGE
jgi:uncharacterized Ntn-hydrolase superfamily protein